MHNYSCTLCKRDHVKLWRNANGANDLLCASCAEKLQATRQCVKGQWKEENGQFIRCEPLVLVPLPKWKVDENGEIPYVEDTAPNEVPSTTPFLPLCWGATFIPALPVDDTTIFYEYNNAPEKEIERWRKLPTKLPTRLIS